MDDLVEWLRAQLDEDEREAADGIHTAFCVNDVRYPEECVCGWSARVLREVEAKRWVIETLRSYEPDDEWGTEPDMGKRGNNAAGALRRLALPYSDRPGYLEEWKPSGS